MSNPIIDAWIAFGNLLFGTAPPVRKHKKPVEQPAAKATEPALDDEELLAPTTEPLVIEAAPRARQHRYTNKDLISKAIDFRLIAGCWPTRNGRTERGTWHARWAGLAEQVGLPDSSTYRKRFGSLAKAWEAAEAAMLANQDPTALL